MAVAMGANLQRRAIRTSPPRTTPRPFDGDLTGRRPAAGLGAAASQISYLLCRQQFSDAPVTDCEAVRRRLDSLGDDSIRRTAKRGPARFRHLPPAYHNDQYCCGSALESRLRRSYACVGAGCRLHRRRISLGGVSLTKPGRPRKPSGLHQQGHNVRWRLGAPEPLKLNIANVKSPEQCIRIKVTFTSLSGASSSGDVKSAEIQAHWDTSTGRPDSPGDSVVRCVATYLWRFGDSPGPQLLTLRLHTDNDDGSPKIGAIGSYLE